MRSLGVCWALLMGLAAASSSSSSSGSHDAVVLFCNATQYMSIYANDNVTACANATGFSFAFPTISLAVSPGNASAVCATTACRGAYSAIEALNLTDDCYFNNGLSLHADILTPLSENNCSASYNAANGSVVGIGSGSGSLFNTNPFDSTSSQGSSSGSDSSSSDITVATIVSIAVGGLLGFIAVVVAVVWYKRQRLRVLQKAYSEPFLVMKNSINGSGLDDTLPATPGSHSDGDALMVSGRRQHSASTLWNDDELLARHMRVEDLEDIRVIGNGGHGVVFLVRYHQSRLLASKRLVRDSITRERTRALIAEIKLVARLDHPCIVQFVGAAWTTESDLQALFEYMPNGDLCTHLAKTSLESNHEHWTLQKLQIAMDIVEALVYVHSFSPPLVHRDLKSRNVLLTEDMQAKLSDFGVSRFQSDNCTMTAGVGTSRWLAPEVIAGGGEYNQSCDIYSLGVVLSELDTHRLPFSDLRMPSGNSMPEVSILQLVSQGKLMPTFSSTCPDSVRAIALRCLAFDPTHRPNAIEVSYALRTIAKTEFGL